MSAETTIQTAPYAYPNAVLSLIQLDDVLLVHIGAPLGGAIRHQGKLPGERVKPPLTED